MGNTITFLLIVLGIMFLSGIVMAILALYFNIKRKHPIFSIIFFSSISTISTRDISFIFFFAIVINSS